MITEQSWKAFTQGLHNPPFSMYVLVFSDPKYVSWFFYDPKRVNHPCKKDTLFLNFWRFWDHNHVTYVTWLIVKNNTFYVIFWSRLISPFHWGQTPPRGGGSYEKRTNKQFIDIQKKMYSKGHSIRMYHFGYQSNISLIIIGNMCCLGNLLGLMD